MTSYLHADDPEGFHKITFKNNGFGEYTAGRILAENKVDQVITQRPDIVLFEISIINDHGGAKGNAPIDQTIKNISAVVDKLKAGLPDAQIILLSPNPLAPDVSNKLNLKLDDYEANMKEFILSKGWSLIDVYSGFKSCNFDMKSLTIADGIHPNDAGYKAWFEIMKSEFENKQ